MGPVDQVFRTDFCTVKLKGTELTQYFPVIAFIAIIKMIVLSERQQEIVNISDVLPFTVTCLSLGFVNNHIY